MCIFVYREEPAESKYRHTTGYTCSQSYEYGYLLKNIFVYSMLPKIKVNRIKARLST